MAIDSSDSKFLFVLSFTGNDIDEDELEKELEELEQEELDKELLGVNAPEAELPEVPTGELKDKTKVKKKGITNATNQTFLECFFR